VHLKFHSVAVDFTLIHKKQIVINIHKQNKNTVPIIQNTVNASTHITKTPTRFSKHPHITQQDKNKHRKRYTQIEIVTLKSSTLSIRLP
jgi:hypothetical protein